MTSSVSMDIISSKSAKEELQQEGVSQRLTACPHTKQFIPKLYNETSYKESSYKFQSVHTQETSYK